MKKFFYGLLALVALFGFMSCDPETGNMPTATLSIQNGSLNIDPAVVNRIDVTFDQPMDTNYSGFIYYGDILGDCDECYWANSYTYIFTVDLRYNTSYKLIFNDSTYASNNPDFSKAKSFIRSKKGKYAEETIIEFSTIKSPNTHPYTYDFNLNNLYTNYPCKLAINEYEQDNVSHVNQQLKLWVKPLINHDMPKAGDTVIVTYKLKSAYNLDNVKVNLVDTSKSANYWKILNENGDEALAKGFKVSTVDNEEIYEGSITFTLKEPMVGSELILQMWSEFDPSDKNADTISFEFASK